MDAEFWIGQLGRIYLECKPDQLGSASSKPLADRYNEALEKIKEDFPENDFVQTRDPISPGYESAGLSVTDRVTGEVRSSPGPTKYGSEDILEIKLACASLADAIGYDRSSR